MHSRIFFLALLIAGSSALDQPKQPAPRMLRAQGVPAAAGTLSNTLRGMILSFNTAVSVPKVVGLATVAGAAVAVPTAIVRHKRKVSNNADQQPMQ